MAFTFDHCQAFASGTATLWFDDLGRWRARFEPPTSCMRGEYFTNCVGCDGFVCFINWYILNIFVTTILFINRLVNRDKIRPPTEPHYSNGAHFRKKEHHKHVKMFLLGRNESIGRYQPEPFEGNLNYCVYLDPVTRSIPHPFSKTSWSELFSYL